MPPFTSGAAEGSSEVGEEEKPLSTPGGGECEHKSELYRVNLSDNGVHQSAGEAGGLVH